VRVEIRRWWSKSRFGCLSLALSLAEIAIMWGDVALVQRSDRHSMQLLLNVNSAAWLIGGLGSLGFAVAGLVADSHQLTALVAVFVTVAAFVICGVQMLV
jgi:hypothetical protein